MTIILDVPCVFSFVGANRRQSVYRERYGLHQVPVTLEVLDRLPLPFISIADGYNPEARPVDFYMIDGTLLRTVYLEYEPASLNSIENPSRLISPPNFKDEWFPDHPSSIFRTAKRPQHYSHHNVVDDVTEYQIVESDLHERLVETRETWSRCLVYDGEVLAPVRPPTWSVMVDERSAYIKADFVRELGNCPVFHFAIEHEHLAYEFAERVADEVIDDLGFFCTPPTSTAGHEVGALETARQFAFQFCKRYAGRRMDSMSFDEVRIFASLRSLFEGRGTDFDAEAVLVQVEALEWPRTSPVLRDWLRLLKIRREMLDDYLAVANAS